jgi:6-phosphogluconolactonase
MSGIEVLDDASVLARTAAQRIAEHLAAAIRARGRAALALAGGSTPRATYTELARAPALAGQWERVHLFWGDERWVAPDSPDSNFRLAQDSLLAGAPVPARNVHPIPTSGTGPDDAARTYEAELHRYMDESGPTFDVALQGLGGDGHTASLFPGDAALAETARWAVGVPLSPDPPKCPRVTLTLPVLNRSEHVAFLVAGAGKAEILAVVLAGRTGADATALPAARVRGRVSTTWFVDRLAASRLPDGTASRPE